MFNRLRGVPIGRPGFSSAFASANRSAGLYAGPWIDLLRHPSLAVARAGDTGTFIDANGKLRVASANTLRLDYSNSAGAGILIEREATNLALRSNEFSNAAWVKSNCTVAGSVDDGEGGTNAFSLTATASNGSIQQAPTVTDGVDYVSSFYLKRLVGAGTISLRCGGATNIPVTISSAWARAQVSAVPSTTTGRIAVVIGTSADAVAAKYGQLELGEFATSYIPTVGSSNTRAADDVSLLLSALPQWNAVEGAIFNEFVAGPDVASKTLLDIHDGTTDNRIHIGTDASGNPEMTVTSGGVLQATVTGGDAIVANTRNKLAVSFAEDAFNMALNGVMATPVTSGLIPVVTGIQFGADLALTASTFLNGHESRVAYYRTAMGSKVQEMTA